MPTLPPVHPDTTASGIATDPSSQERVVPSSVRADGSVRKELRIRPGFTPQEDVQRFRGTRQQDLDKRQLPPGHILGWVAPSSETKKVGGSGAAAAVSKSAAKNAKRNAKKKEEKQKALEEKIRECWEDDDDTVKRPKVPEESPGESSNADVKSTATDAQEEDSLAEGMSKLAV